MTENRKLGEAEDEVKNFREAHHKLAVVVTTTEIAIRTVPQQRMFIGERDHYEDDFVPEPLLHSQTVALTPRQEQQPNEELIAMADWVGVLKKNTSLRVRAREVPCNPAPRSR